jgi:ABC-type proline/glycine betaine transport system permease subunit
MNKKNFPILSTVLYILAGLLVIFAIWSSSKSISYISQMINLGQLVFSGNEFDIINFIMSSCAQYVIFAVILFTLGQILQKCQFSVSGVSNQVVGENPDELSEEISDQNITVETPEE